MKHFLLRFVVWLSLFAFVAEPLVADAHLMLDGTGGAEICSALHAYSGHSHSPQDHAGHQHDCCVAMAAFAKTGAHDFFWQPEPFRFSAPSLDRASAHPALAWQLRRSRAPPSSLV